jgi:hypothetical protein
MPLRWLGVDLKLSHFELARLGADRNEPADALGHNSWDRLSSSAYGSVYARTATTLRDLEQRLGKEVMEHAFKTYYGRWKFRHPSIADFRDTLIEVSGRRDVIETVFAQQVYGAQKVDDRIDKFTSKEELPQPGTALVKGAWIEETQEQVDKRIDQLRERWTKDHPRAGADSGPFPYRTTVTVRRRGVAVPQELRVRFADGSVETVQWNADSRWERFSWVKPVKAVAAELDASQAHFLDASKLDDSRTIKPDRSASQRWGGQFAALVQVLTSLVAAL